MLWGILLFLLLAAAGTAFYFYRYFKRMLGAFGADAGRRGTCLLAAAMTAMVAVFLWLWGSLALIFVLHWLFLALIMQAAYCLIRRFRNPALLRRIYASGLVPVVLAAAVLGFGCLNMHRVVQTDYTILTEKPIRDEGYRIILIGDVHFGISLDEEALQEVCSRISEQNPDLVVLCGDIVDNNTTRQEMETVFRIFGTVESRYGVCYVYGNHDRPMSIIGSAFTAEELENAILGSGIRILEDQVWQMTEDLAVAGRRDRGFDQKPRLSVTELLSQTDPEDFLLVLDHQPAEYAENGAAGTDLLLSGHTHGGQIWPVNLLDHLFRFNDHNYGLLQINDDTAAVVTSGLAGWGFPVKTAAPAEYVVLEIQSP